MQDLRKILILCLFGLCGFIAVFIFFNESETPKEALSELDLRHEAKQNLQISNLDSKDNQTNDIESKSQDSKADTKTTKVSKDSKKITESKPKTPKDSTQNTNIKKPYIVIIIDDLANAKDIKKFHDLNLKLNLSLFPKYDFSKDNPRLAKSLPFFMIHLPLEAQNFSQKGVKVINVGDSKDSINDFISEIKRDFPALKYLNNHTGSKFSASLDDMQRLLQVLDKHKITFVDSVTTAKSAAATIFKGRKNTPYLHRNVFLDNENNEKYIAAQLESALKFAHKNGYVIAIGHPKKETYNVLKSYAPRLQKDYNMLYIHELDSILRTHNNDGTTPLKIIESKKDKDNKADSIESTTHHTP